MHLRGLIVIFPLLCYSNIGSGVGRMILLCYADRSGVSRMIFLLCYANRGGVGLVVIVWRI